MFDYKELENINIVSLPIMDLKYVKNLRSYLVKGNTLFITDSSKTVFFDDVYMKIKEFLINCKIKNFDLDHRDIKYVDNEKGLLEQMGVKKEIIKNLL
jgi:hypothetical protein